MFIYIFKHAHKYQCLLDLNIYIRMVLEMFIQKLELSIQTDVYCKGGVVYSAQCVHYSNVCPHFCGCVHQKIGTSAAQN